MEVHILVVCIVTHSVFMELKFTQYKCGFQRFRCFGMWHCCVWVILNISSGWDVSFFAVKQSKSQTLKMKALRFLETQRTTYAVPQHDILKTGIFSSTTTRTWSLAICFSKRFTTLEHKLVIQFVKRPFLQSIHTGSRAHTALYQWVLGALSLMVKMAVTWRWPCFTLPFHYLS